MHPKTHCTLAATLCLAPLGGLAQSAWIPEQQELRATPGFSFSTFDEFWVGRTKVKSDGDLDQYSGYVSLEYGILKNLAADATIGYTATDTDAFDTAPFGGASDEGLADTYLGLRYRVIDERTAGSRWAPTLTLRAGAVIPGTYDSNLPFSAGDGAHAFEGSVLFGKAIGNFGFGLYGDIGYRVRESPVPDDVFGTVGIYQQIDAFTLTVGYRHTQGLSGLDIEGAGWDPGAGRSSGFPALREITQIVEGGISYTDKGRRNYQITVGRSVDGRNTGDRLIVGVNVTFSFGGQ